MSGFRAGTHGEGGGCGRPWKSARASAGELAAHFAPGAIGEECALRARIHIAHGTAHSRACEYASFDAGRIAHIASGIAAGWMFRRDAPLDDLQEVIRILTWLFLAAGALERLEARDEE